MEILKNFFVLEGLDGSGTTTQGKLLNEKITHSVFTHEPTNGKIGQLARQVLKNEYPTTPLALAHIFAADRSEHLFAKDGIVNQCQSGLKVICDRYFFSSVAYQSLEVDFDLICQINNQFPLPQILFFIDTPVEVCLQRISSRNESEIFDKKNLQEKVLTNYLKILDRFQNQGMQIIKIDGTQTVEQILAEELQYLI